MEPEREPQQRRRTVAEEAVGVGTLVLLCAVAAYGWNAIGPDNPIYAVMITCGTFGLGPWIGKPLERRAPGDWFRAHPVERQPLLLLGVPAFGRLLEASRWNRMVADPMRDFGGSRDDLPDLERHLRGTMGAHGVSFLIHLLLSLAATATGHLAGALWLLLPGVILHLYPTLLQRWISLRIHPLRHRR